TAFARARALAADAVEKIASALSLVVFALADDRIAMLSATWQRLRDKIGLTLDAFHAERPDLPGIGLEQLRKTDKPALPVPLFMPALRRLTEAGDVVLDRTWVRRPQHEVRFSKEEERI